MVGCLGVQTWLGARVSADVLLGHFEERCRVKYEALTADEGLWGWQWSRLGARSVPGPLYCFEQGSVLFPTLCTELMVAPYPMH